MYYMNKICTEEQHDSYTWLFYNILNSLLLRVLSHALYTVYAYFSTMQQVLLYKFKA